MQQQLWVGVGAALFLAVIAGLGERKRKRRDDLDRIGLISWPLVQVLSILAALILASMALNLR